MAAADTARLIAELTLRDKMSAGLRTATASLGTFESSVGRVGKGAGQLAGGLVRVGAIAAGAAAAGLGVAAKSAIDFEDAFAGVRKTVDEADLAKAGLSFDALAKSFRGMATEIPIAATEFARIGEAAGALGIAAGDIDDFTKTVALLGVTTNLTSDEAAASLGKIGTILGLTGKEFEQFGDALVNLGNKGASTESEIIEITKRFGAAGVAAGLSTDQILAFSSAIASAGVEPEAAGSSLSRLFGNLIKETALATEKGEAFAEVSGKSFKDFSKIVKTDTVGAMLLFLDSLKELDKFEQEIALKEVGITNVRDRNAIRLLAETYDRNLVPALENAKNASGALSTEASKRFDTLRSKLTLLKQNFIEGALTVGEGFTPALGRATDKLIAFLKVDANKSALKDLGEDIGKAIDGIDWGKVLEGARTFLDVMKTIAGVVLAIPNEIKAAGIALIGLNKLSGGLFGAGAGNIIGGLAGALTKGIAAKVPGVGSLFAQPVHVVNFPPGFGGTGVGPGSKGAGALGLITKVFLVGMAAEVASLLAPAVTDAGRNVHTSLGLDKTPLGDFGKEWQKFRDTAPWPFGQWLWWDTDKPPGSPADPGPKPQTGGLSPDERGEKIAAAIAKVLGTHVAAVAAFGSKELAAFRTTAEGAISLFDERLKYLSGAQGSGAGTENYLALVQRDIDALTSIIPTASADQAAKITGQIEILQGIIDAKKFEPTAELLGALSNQRAIDSEILAATRDAGSKTSDASRATAAATRELGGIVRDKDMSPSITVRTNVNVSTSVSVRDQVRKTRSAVATGTTYGIS